MAISTARMWFRSPAFSTNSQTMAQAWSRVMRLLLRELQCARQKGLGVRLAGGERAVGLVRGIQEALPPVRGVLPQLRGIRGRLELSPLGPLVSALGRQVRDFGPDRSRGGAHDEGPFDVAVPRLVPKQLEVLHRDGYLGGVLQLGPVDGGQE